ncbi:MAG TPA: CT583 family protein [Chlamydiales bacterium]|nr:CT583 family protein [Chlamydiales bacterium]
MAKFNSLLNLRLKQKEEDQSKMKALAQRATQGNLSGFSGVFQIGSLTEKEKDNLSHILRSYRDREDVSLEDDLEELTTITSEVKAITNQAVILHGERIKKAQAILKKYQEGAFTAWLMSTYGNRQTPYNFLQYYEFYSSMPKELHQKIDDMPRQAIYTLASREGEIGKKQEIVQQYQGQTKQEMLTLIRETFPLDETDKRFPNLGKQVAAYLNKALKASTHPRFYADEKTVKRIKKFIQELENQFLKDEE